MSAASRGAEGEVAVERHLVAAGLRVHRARPNKAPIRRGGRVFWVTNSNDIFGVFDGVAVRRDGPVLWYQVCHPAGVRARRRKIEAELVPYWNLGQLNLSYTVEIWEVRPKFFRVHHWQGTRDWVVTETLRAQP